MSASMDMVFQTVFPFWSDLTDTEQQRLCHESSFISYQKGQIVHSGNDCVGTLIIIDGCLRTFLLSEEGREVTLYRLCNGDVCVLSASCVLDAITFDVMIDAENDTKCLLIPSKLYQELSQRYLQVKNYILELAVNRFSEVMWVFQQILFMRLDQRLAVFLWDELSKTQGDVLSLTHAQIAKYTGSAREAVSRMLKYFSSEGITENLRGGIRILDRAKLQALALHSPHSHQ